jgi:tetrahydromethanopterin S-methyltransferase subunit B
MKPTYITIEIQDENQEHLILRRMELKSPVEGLDEIAESMLDSLNQSKNL